MVFPEWLKASGDGIRAQQRNIVLVHDNANLKLHSVIVVFLLPNTISKLQPLDADIIASSSGATVIDSLSTRWT